MEIARNITLNSLPRKSEFKYKAEYENFIVWKTAKKVSEINEDLLIVYFEELSKKLSPNTLWAKYSMLRTMLQKHHKINIAQYHELLALLKRKNTGYASKKARVLTGEEINKFLTEAPDTKYLATKVAMIMGLSGACRTDELINLTINNIEDQVDFIVVNIPTSKTHKPKKFTVEGNLLKTVKQYMALRPSYTDSSRFFLNSQNGKCHNQVIGKNKISAMPKQVAEFLGLENPKLYTGHAFRRMSPTLLVESGADMLELKRHGAWKSSTVAEGYIEESVIGKRKTYEKISSTITGPDTKKSKPLETINLAHQN